MTKLDVVKTLMRSTHFSRSQSLSSPRKVIAKMASTSTGEKSLKELLPDFPKGPLTIYRKQASFDWRKLKLAIDDENILRFKDTIWSVFQNDEVFQHSMETLPLDKQRRIAHKRMKALNAKNIMPIEEVVSNPKLPAAWCEAVFMYDVSTAIKIGLTYKMFTNVIRGMGTERHYKYIEAIDNCEIGGCFALTEIAHGSNAKGMRTTATYNVQNKEYILHSADFEAAKCWVGSLGKCATHAVVYAKLITPDGKDHGLHAFVVAIRCTRSLKPFAGVIVGDLGEKIAINGVDNGFVMFNNYRIPAESLLNKLGDVDETGNYVTPFKDPSKRFGASLGILSGGRVQICGMAANQLQKAISIALRYAAVRKQFGPENSTQEYAVIEYQQLQFRLLPYLAAAFATRIFSNWICEVHTEFSVQSAMGVKSGDDAFKGMEMHALSSAAKPTVAWTARDGIQVCREACGGHGYLKATGIGEIRNENDASCTYEGENSILIQQTSNWLLGLWRGMQGGEAVNSPFQTADFLNNCKDILASSKAPTNTKDITDPITLLNAYKWLVCFTLQLTAEKAEKLSKEGLDNFTIRNETQAFYAASLSVLYAEHAILERLYKFSMNVGDGNCKAILLKLVSLYGAWSLEKHLGTLYMGGYFSANAGILLRDGVLELCRSIKPDAISLVDTIAPPDFILNSVLGYSDGYVYQNLQAAIFSYPGALSRPNWWHEVVSWNTTLPSKL